MAIESINPATNQLLRSFEPLTSAAARQKIALAEDAFRAYAVVPLEHRALWMRKLASILEHETKELATLITLEMGKPLEAVRFEILKSPNVCRYYAEHAGRIVAPESIPIDPNYSYVRWDPLGIVLAVMPWNFPFWQVFRFLAPALMAGNVALLKHASNVPQCALAIEALVRRAGFPRGTFQALLVEVSQVETILADERIAAVTLTGSETAGRVGARILTGGERMLGEGNYFEPTVLTGVPRTSAVYREELFGPVAMLFRVQDLNEAIEIANDTPFGLAASAWTRDPAEQQRLVAELQCGGVFLNTMVASDPRLPFGGTKRSGYGRELSAAGMREFLNAKTVVIASANEASPKPYYMAAADTPAKP